MSVTHGHGDGSRSCAALQGVPAYQVCAAAVRLCRVCAFPAAARRRDGSPRGGDGGAPRQTGSDHQLAGSAASTAKCAPEWSYGCGM